MKDPKLCHLCAKKTSAFGLIAGIFLAIFKLTFGFAGNSHALIAGGVSHISDISSSIMLFLGMKFSQKKPSRFYPYGLGKAEFVAQVGVSGTMLLGTIALVLSSFIHLHKRSLVIPHILVFFVAIISAVISSLIYKFAQCGYRQMNSPTLKAHAEHNKIDVAGSLLVAAGVIGTRFGLHWADPVIAIFEAVHIIHASFEIFMEGIKGLMDSAAPEAYVEEVENIVSGVAGVEHVALVRARSSGTKMILDVTIEVDPKVSVLESKTLVQLVKARLRERDNYLGSILVQIRPAAGISDRSQKSLPVLYQQIA